MSIPTAVLKALQNQVTAERTNRDFYRCAGFQLDGLNWPGSSKWFIHGSHEEQHHADWFSKYINARNGAVIYDTIPAIPLIASADILPFFETALAKEKATTEKINALYQLSDQEEDPQTCQFLHYFLKEQTRSEREITDYVLELKRGDATAHILFDKKLKH